MRYFLLFLLCSFNALAQDPPGAHRFMIRVNHVAFHSAGLVVGSYVDKQREVPNSRYSWWGSSSSNYYAGSTRRDNDWALQVWSTNSGSEFYNVNLAKRGDVNSIAIHPKELQAAFGGAGVVNLWDFSEKTDFVYKVALGAGVVKSIAYNADGSLIAGGSGKVITIWNAKSGREIRTVYLGKNSANSLTFSPDGSTIVYGGDKRNRIKTLNVNSGKKLRDYGRHSRVVTALAYSPDGSLLASGSSDETVKIWDVRSHKLTRTISFNVPVKAVSFDADGDSLNVATSAYWTVVPMNGKAVRQPQQQMTTAPEKMVTPPSYTPSVKGYATFFWHEAALRNSTEQAPARFAQKVVTLSGQWNGDFGMKDMQVSLFLNGKKIPLNGKGLSSDKQTKNSSSISQTVTLNEGSNYVQWKLQRPDGRVFESEIKYLFYDDISQPNLYLYAIGVKSDLKYTMADAQKVADIFRKQKGRLFREVSTTVLVGDETDASKIKLMIERSIGNNDDIRPQDVVLIYFSSHGLPSSDEEFILQGKDFDPRAQIQTTIRYRENILRFLKDRPCKTVLFLDACYSGGSRGKADMQKALAATPPGIVMISSSQGIEQSWEHVEWKHGSFTYALIKALENGEADLDQNGAIFLSELYEYLKNEVPKQNTSKGLLKQHPQIKNAKKEDFQIFLR